jgi:hypothetical protein
MKTFFIELGLFLLIGISIFGFVIKTSNSEKGLRNKISAQQEMCEAYYTKLWEIIKTKAGVADEYANKFKEIQIGIMEGRYSTGGEMMKWIQEANPDFDASLYKDIMNSIEGERNGFFIEQKKLRDMKTTHDNMVDMFPSNIIVAKRSKIDIVILKNVATKAAYESGMDSSPKLFN